MHMLSKSKAKFIRSLQLRKSRQKYHKIIVEGIKILNELIDEYPQNVVTICGQSDWYEKFSGTAPETCEVILVSEKEMKQISSFKTPPPVLAVVEPIMDPAQPDDPSQDLCLYLDSIRDPGNLGTILRVADWFGIRSVFLSPDTVDIYNPKVIQSSMASIFRVKWAYVQIEDLLQGQNVFVLASTLDGKHVSQFKDLRSGLLVLGNESRGISDETLKWASDRVQIPGSHKLGAESLNVAVAAGILCAYLRQSGRE